MDYIVIEGVKPWDGRYEFDLAGAELTTREWGWIKRHSGYLPLTIEQGFEGGDPELFAVFAAIALRRAGKIEPRELGDVYERIADAPFGATIQMESDTVADDEEADAGPPERSSNGNAASSGDDSPTSSASSEATPPATGTPASATTASAPGR